MSERLAGLAASIQASLEAAQADPKRQMKKPVPLTVSVIIVSWNVRELLEQCLLSLEPRTAPPDPIEVVVVDNGSHDGSVAMVREKFPWAKVIDTELNLGFGPANNLGAQRAAGEVLFLLNPDTIVHEQALETLIDFLTDHPDAGLVAPRLLNADGSLQRNAFRFPGLLQTLLDLFPLHPRLMESRLNGRYTHEHDAANPFEIDHPLGAAMLVRREAFDSIAGFDEGFFMYAEEVDLCLRLHEAAWQIWQVPTARVTHFGGQSTGQVRGGMFVELWRARLRLYRLHHTPTFRAVARLIVRAGMLRKLLATIMDERSGRVSHEAARELRRAYGMVFRL